MLSREFIEDIWYNDHPLRWLLLPFSWIYQFIFAIRRICYQSGIIPVTQLDVPVIIVGNVTVGGTGKTPLVIHLANYFWDKGFRPGVISRGYGGAETSKPQQVRPDSNPDLVGDEPVLISRNTRCPVAVAKKRNLAAEELVSRCRCNMIICDDGLQHFALDRNLEIAVIDGVRRFGNELCLPAGPLREPISRLKNVDLIVSKTKASRHEFKMDYEYKDLVLLRDMQQQKNIEELAGETVHAVAGIGNPDRFYAYLRNNKINIIMHTFPDHYKFTKTDISFNDGLPVIMTEKDAIKCFDFAGKSHWYLPIKAKLPEAFTHRLDSLMKEILNG